MAINYKTLVEGYTKTDRKDWRRVDRITREAFAADPELRDNFDCGRLFEEVFGWHDFRECRADRSRSVHTVFEAAGAVNTAAFANTIGQWAWGQVQASYELPEIVFSKVIPTRKSNLLMERNPGVTEIGDEALVVDEAENYPIVGVSESWTETPQGKKRGFIVPVTWEAIFFDRTQGEMRNKVTRGADWLAINKEKRAIDCVIDAGETAQNKYRWRWMGSTPIATYGNNSGTHNWDNLAATNPFTSNAALETAWNLAALLTDPYTGEPIAISFKDLIVPPTLVWKVPVVMGGVQTQLTPGYATTGNPVSTQYANPAGSIIGSLRTLSSTLLQARMTAMGEAANTWYMGDVAGAFEYIENLATETKTAPAGHEDEFNKDIVLKTKVREMGTYSTKEPRKMLKNTVA